MRLGLVDLRIPAELRAGLLDALRAGMVMIRFCLLGQGISGMRTQRSSNFFELLAFFVLPLDAAWKLTRMGG